MKTVNDSHEKIGLEWTGHPFADVGVATLCAMVGKQNPADLTMGDLDAAADEMSEYYFSGVMQAFTSCVFTMNAYDNPTSSREKLKEYEQEVLRGHRSLRDPDAQLRTCVFSGHRATHLLERRQMPLLTGSGVMNFYPEGLTGLPVWGPYVVALQALPLGGRRAEGRLLVAHSDLPEITLAFVEDYLRRNRRLLALARTGELPKAKGPHSLLNRENAAGVDKKGKAKYPDAKAAPSLITADLMEILQQTAVNTKPTDIISVTAFWISNSGQGPIIDVFQIPSQVVRFISQASSAHYRPWWSRLVRQSWAKIKVSRKKTVPGGPGRSRNRVLTDLLSIYSEGLIDPAGAQRFVRRHLLANTLNAMKEIVSGSVEAEQEDWGLMVPWKALELFLKEVMGMDQTTVSAIRDFADRLAEHIDKFNDRGLFRGIVYARYAWELRQTLTKAQRNEARQSNRLLFGLDKYLQVFEAADGVGRVDWSLTRDLISIRLVERLYQLDFFSNQENAGVLEEPAKVSTGA